MFGTIFLSHSFLAYVAVVIALIAAYVLRRTRMPATLIELGYITNANDARLMNENPRLFARGIYSGILRYLRLT